VTRAELQRFKGPVYTDKLVNSTPTSQLHPYVLAGATDGTESIIRWASTPVWIKGPGSPGPPDGVLVFGSIVNGKQCLVETVRCARSVCVCVHVCICQCLAASSMVSSVS
jgi:hypothetical protein